MASRKPNVILITTDQQRYDTLGCVGNTVIRTPNLDRLAAEGLRFDRSYASSPVCMPSRASMFTGRYPRAHGVWNVGVNLPECEQGLAHAFRQAGYRTANIGKLHFTNMNEPKKGGKGSIESIHRNTGYDSEEVDHFWRNFNGDYYGFETFKSVLQHGNRTIGGGHYDLWLRDNHPETLNLMEPAHASSPLTGAMQSWKTALPSELHNSNWIADETIEYLEDHQNCHLDQPFFLWCNFPDPHYPLCPPKEYCDMYDPEDMPSPVPNVGELDHMPPHHQLYYNKVVQKHITGEEYKLMGYGRNEYGLSGTVSGEYSMSEMPKSHLREIMAHYYGLITLVDDAVGRILQAVDRMGLTDETIIIFNSDHGDLMGDHGLVFKGPFHYEGVIKIPTIWRWPGRIEPGQVTDALISHVDILPTLMDACELDIPKGVQGISQLPVLEGTRQSCRSWVLTEHRENIGGLQAKTLVTNRYKLTYYPTKTYGELFDLQFDPKEYVNLWDRSDYQELKGRLLNELLEILCITENPLPQRTSYS